PHRAFEDALLFQRIDLRRVVDPVGDAGQRTLRPLHRLRRIGYRARWDVDVHLGLSTVIPGRAEGASPESSFPFRIRPWIPGSGASLAPRSDSEEDQPVLRAGAVASHHGQTSRATL